MSRNTFKHLPNQVNIHLDFIQQLPGYADLITIKIRGESILKQEELDKPEEVILQKKLN